MAGLREYVLGIIAVVSVCGIVSLLPGNGSAKELIRMLSGILLAITIVKPLGQIDLRGIETHQGTIREDWAQIAEDGAQLAHQEQVSIIKSEAEAYILDKAAELGISLTADVTVSNDEIPIPSAVRLTGAVSPYARQRLERILEADLGIPKENQRWTG